MQVLLVICCALLHVTYAQNCTFPDDIAGKWLQEDGKSMESNSENYTLDDGESQTLYNCYMSVPENDTFIAKRVDGETTYYMCVAYKKINNNVFMTYTKDEETVDTAPSDVYGYCGGLMEYPTPGALNYNSQTLEAVQCAPIGQFEWEREGCVNKTSKYEVCSGDYTSILYTEGCAGMDGPLINGTMDCLASWDGTEGLKYTLVKTGTIGEDDTNWDEKFACVAYKLNNKTLTLTAKTFQCQGKQTDKEVNGNGLISVMKQVNDAGDCIPPTTDSSAVGVLTRNLNIVAIVTIITVIAVQRL